MCLLTFLLLSEVCSWCECYSPLWLFLLKEITAFEFSLPRILSPFFPPLFSHLICSSFCWTLLCPSPFLPFSFQLLHPPSTLLSSTICIFLLILLLFYSLSSCYTQRFITPLGTQVHNTVSTECVRRAKERRVETAPGTCYRQCVLKSFTC